MFARSRQRGSVRGGIGARRAAAPLAVAIALVAGQLVASGASGAVRVATASRWVQLAELRPNPNAGGPFAYSVAVSGSAAVVGAPGANRAYVFEFGPAGWQQVAVLRTPSALTFDRFGEAVAVFGNTIVVGAPGVLRGGRAFVFRRVDARWQLWRELHGSDVVATDDSFGGSVGVAGSVIAVGASTHRHMGMAYLFGLRRGTWRQFAKFHAKDTATNDEYAYSLSLSPQFLVVGALGHGATGAAYVYSKVVGWKQVAEFYGSRHGELFGWSVSVSGETAVIGAPGPFDHVPRISGRAYVYVTRPGRPWHGMAVLHGGPSNLGSFYGFAVAASNSRIAVGAWSNLARPSPTYVYAPARSQTVWVPIGHLYAHDLPVWSLFGQSVAASGSTVIVGAPSPRDTGRTYVYRT